MDRSTTPQSTLPYVALSSTNYHHQEKKPSQVSPPLIACGIILIVTSILGMIPSSVILVLMPSNVANVWFVLNVLFLLVAMHSVYGGCNVEERHETIVCTMLMGIVATTGTVPIIINYCIAIVPVPHNIDVDIQLIIVITSAMSTINITLAVAIAIITLKKICTILQDSRGKSL